MTMTLTEMYYSPQPEFFIMLKDLQHNFYVVCADTILKQETPMIMPVNTTPRFYKPRTLISNDSEFILIGRA